MKNKNNVKTQKIVIAILVTVILLIGGTYARLVFSVNGTTSNDVIVGNLELSLEDGKEIDIENATPVEDSVGNTYDPYHFTLKNTGNVSSTFDIYIDDATLDSAYQRMDDKFIRYNLSRNGVSLGNKSLSDLSERKLYSGSIDVDETIEFDLRMWMDVNSTNEAMNKVFAGKIRVEASQIKE